MVVVRPCRATKWPGDGGSVAFDQGPFLLISSPQTSRALFRSRSASGSAPCRDQVSTTASVANRVLHITAGQLCVQDGGLGVVGIVELHDRAYADAAGAD